MVTAYTPTFGGATLHLAAKDSLVVTLCVGALNFILMPVMGRAVRSNRTQTYTAGLQRARNPDCLSCDALARGGAIVREAHDCRTLVLGLLCELQRSYGCLSNRGHADEREDHRVLTFLQPGYGDLRRIHPRHLHLVDSRDFESRDSWALAVLRGSARFHRVGNTESMTNPVRRVSSRQIHEGRLVRLRLDSVVLPRGTEAVFEHVEIKNGSSTLAMEENGDVWLVREWKYAIERPSLEVVSGGIEPGEEPLDAARRELREEAGLTAAKWTSMSFVDPFTNSHVALPEPSFFWLEELTPVARDPEEGEVMELACRSASGGSGAAGDGGRHHARFFQLLRGDPEGRRTDADRRAVAGSSFSLRGFRKRHEAVADTPRTVRRCRGFAGIVLDICSAGAAR